MQIVAIRLDRGILAPRIEYGVRVESLFKAAMQAFADGIERMKDRNVTVAMPKQYGMAAGFCDLVSNLACVVVAVYPTLGASPIGQHLLLTMESLAGRCERQAPQRAFVVEEW